MVFEFEEWYTLEMKIFLFFTLGLFIAPAMAEDNLFPDDSLKGWYIVGPQIDFTVKDGVLTAQIIQIIQIVKTHLNSR